MSEKKAPMGRPRKAPADKRGERVVCVVTPRVKRALTRARGALTESAYVASILERALLGA